MGSESEHAKDTLQVITEQAADHLSRIAQIITTAVRDIAHELGDWMSDAMEVREASQRTREDSD